MLVQGCNLITLSVSGKWIKGYGLQLRQPNFGCIHPGVFAVYTLENSIIVDLFPGSTPPQLASFFLHSEKKLLGVAWG